MNYPVEIQVILIYLWQAMFCCGINATTNCKFHQLSKTNLAKHKIKLIEMFNGDGNK